MNVTILTNKSIDAFNWWTPFTMTIDVFKGWAAF